MKAVEVLPVELLLVVVVAQPVVLVLKVAELGEQAAALLRLVLAHALLLFQRCSYRNKDPISTLLQIWSVNFFLHILFSN